MSCGLGGGVWGLELSAHSVQCLNQSMLDPQSPQQWWVRCRQRGDVRDPVHARGPPYRGLQAHPAARAGVASLPSLPLWVGVGQRGSTCTLRHAWSRLCTPLRSLLHRNSHPAIMLCGGQGLQPTPVHLPSPPDPHAPCACWRCVTCTAAAAPPRTAQRTARPGARETYIPKAPATTPISSGR